MVCYRMSFWDQITTYPALTIGPVLVAAVVSGLISILIASGNRKATSADVDRKIRAESEATDRKIVAESDATSSKIDAERALTDIKFAHEKEKVLSERAWADYGLRRDVYLQLADRIDYMFAGNQPPAPAPSTGDSSRKAFHETARKVRLIASDEVVDALNAMTTAIKEGKSPDVTQRLYSELMNAIRVDIRTLNEKPPVGTRLDTSAFPIES